MLVTTNLGNSQIPRLVSWTPAKARFDSVIGQCLVAKLLGGSFGIEKLNKTGEVQTEMLRFDRLILAPDLYCSKSEVFGMAWTQSLGLTEAPTPYRDTFASKSQDPTTTNHSRPTKYRFPKAPSFDPKQWPNHQPSDLS